MTNRDQTSSTKDIFQMTRLGRAEPHGSEIPGRLQVVSDHADKPVDGIAQGPSTFRCVFHARHPVPLRMTDYLVGHELDLSALDAQFKNDEVGASAYDPRVTCYTSAATARAHRRVPRTQSHRRLRVRPVGHWPLVHLKTQCARDQRLMFVRCAYSSAVKPEALTMAPHLAKSAVNKARALAGVLCRGSKPCLL